MLNVVLLIGKDFSVVFILLRVWCADYTSHTYVGEVAATARLTTMNTLGDSAILRILLVVYLMALSVNETYDVECCSDRNRFGRKPLWSNL